MHSDWNARGGGAYLSIPVLPAGSLRALKERSRLRSHCDPDAALARPRYRDAVTEKQMRGAAHFRVA